MIFAHIDVRYIDHLYI